MEYLILAVIAFMIIAIIVVALYLQYKTQPIVIANPDTEIKTAKSAVEGTKVIKADVAAQTEKLKAAVEASQANEAKIISKAENKKSEITAADSSKIKNFLEKEGYHVEEIFPE